MIILKRVLNFTVFFKANDGDLLTCFVFLSHSNYCQLKVVHRYFFHETSLDLSTDRFRNNAIWFEINNLGMGRDATMKIGTNILEML